LCREEANELILSWRHMGERTWKEKIIKREKQKSDGREEGCMRG
jgi:hypothetical protein